MLKEPSMTDLQAVDKLLCVYKTIKVAIYNINEKTYKW